MTFIFQLLHVVIVMHLHTNLCFPLCHIANLQIPIIQRRILGSKSIISRFDYKQDKVSIMVIGVVEFSSGGVQNWKDFCLKIYPKEIGVNNWASF